MKHKTKIIFCIYLLIVIGCSEKSIPTASNFKSNLNIKSLKISSGEIASIIEDTVFKSLLRCCNNLPPLYTNPPDWHMSIKWCPPNPPEVDIQSDSCGWLWSHNVEWGDRLYGSACNEDNRKYFTAPVEWITGTTSNYHPSLTWDFIYGSGYQMKRKVGINGRWLSVMTTSVVEDTTWIDTGIDIRTINDPVYYKVYSKVYSSYASSGPQKVYYPSD